VCHYKRSSVIQELVAGPGLVPDFQKLSVKIGSPRVAIQKALIEHLKLKQIALEIKNSVVILFTI